MCGLYLCFLLHPTASMNMTHCLLWAVTPQRQSIVDGMRTIALKLEFGVSHNQIFERYYHCLSLNLQIMHSCFLFIHFFFSTF
jgi:hypothetical protein